MNCTGRVTETPSIRQVAATVAPMGKRKNCQKTACRAAGNMISTTGRISGQY